MAQSVTTWATDHGEAYAMLTEVVRRELPAGAGPVKIVEAGCGRDWVLGDLGRASEITGVDLDEEALRIRIEDKGDLDQVIQGDLMEVELPSDSYDMVFSSYVLEHLAEPDVALDRFFDWLREGGLCAVIIPDKDTAKGFATRMSPHTVHIWYYRWVKGRETAGKPGYEPYKTFYGPVVGRKGLAAYARDRGHEVVAEMPISMRSSDEGLLTMAACRVIKWLSFGRRTDRYCNVVVVMRAR
jgi:SAM-dependent methyltransferase